MVIKARLGLHPPAEACSSGIRAAGGRSFRIPQLRRSGCLIEVFIKLCSLRFANPSWMHFRLTADPRVRLSYSFHSLSAGYHSPPSCIGAMTKLSNIGSIERRDDGKLVLAAADPSCLSRQAMGRSERDHLRYRSLYAAGSASSTRCPGAQVTIYSSPSRYPVSRFQHFRTRANSLPTLGFSARTSFFNAGSSTP